MPFGGCVWFLNRPPVVCDQDFGAPCPIDWVLVDNIYNDSLRYCAPGDSHDGPCADQAVGHQRGKCTGSNCVRPSGLASIGCVCLMYCVCWVGNIFVVQSVNGVVLLLVWMVGAPTIEMCAMQERYVGFCRWGAWVFSLRPCVFL